MITVSDICIYCDTDEEAAALELAIPGLKRERLKGASKAWFTYLFRPPAGVWHFTPQQILIACGVQDIYK